MKNKTGWMLLAIFLCFSIVAACSDSDDDPGIGINNAVSECGGFVESDGNVSARVKAVEEPDADSADDDAAADGDDMEMCQVDDVLEWIYDADAKSVTFTNRNVYLNCCGNHVISIDEADGVYTLLERDAPENGDARCDCMCFFDWRIDLPDLDADSLDLRLKRFVTDTHDDPWLVWEGQIDLGENEGSILIEEQEEYCGIL